MEDPELETAIAEMVFDGWSDDEIMAEVRRIVAETRAEFKAKIPAGNWEG